MPGPQSRPFGYTKDGRRVNGKSAMKHAQVKSWRATVGCDFYACTRPMAGGAAGGDGPSVRWCSEHEPVLSVT